MTLKVGLTYNLKRQTPISKALPEDFFVEFDDEETVDAITDALEEAGCKVTKVEADEKAYTTLKKSKFDIVFNIAEGLWGESRESQIPSILEMFCIPYTGSGPLALAISLNKAITHQLLAINRVRSPSFQVFTKVDERLNKNLDLPLIVKPLAEGSSKGIRNNSLVLNEGDLRKRVSWIIKNYGQPAIVEEFLSGREFTVGLLGNDKPLVLPIVEILFQKLPKGASPLYSYEAKWIWDTPQKPLDLFHCPANINEKLRKEIERIAIKTFKVLGCRDLCRIDMRLDGDNIPCVLEVNPLPGLIPNPDAHSCLPEAARVAGYEYNQLIVTILNHAIERCDLHKAAKRL